VLFSYINNHPVELMDVEQMGVVINRYVCIVHILTIPKGILLLLVSKLVKYIMEH
jgi:hypothetical protein